MPLSWPSLSSRILILLVVLGGTLPIASAGAAPQTDGRDLTLEASDGHSVYGTYTQAQEEAHGIILLFHQANANRHEYDAIVPKLTGLGFDTLAIDQRSGGNLFGHENVTVQQRGGSSGYLDAYADLEGALAWAQNKGYETIITLGSSYSSALNIVLAKDHPRAITAAAAFSPGEYFDDKDKIKEAAEQVQIPLYITAEPNKTGKQRLRDVLKKAQDNANITRYLPKQGVHGASTLRQDRDPEGFMTNFRHLKAFLQQAT